MTRLPALPQFLARKIYKTSQTRGSDDDEIYQNRVSRNSTVLIPYEVFINNFKFHQNGFENGFIVLIEPQTFFKNKLDYFKSQKLELGKNFLIFYTKREDWKKYDPNQLKLNPANNRQINLGGHYVARIANTTSSEDQRINKGFTEKKSKGAGIRFYEYCSNEDSKKTKLQLEALFWLSYDSLSQLVKFGMKEKDSVLRKSSIIKLAKSEKILDYDKLEKLRIIDNYKNLICPLCREKISGSNFFSKEVQQDGRQKHDLTITNVNLFHLRELRTNEYNHRLNNLGWGHHYCNMVIGDKGIEDTIKWMKKITSSS